MQRAAAGDRRAFEAAVAPHLRALARLTSAIAGPGCAEDALQDALLQAFRRASTFDPRRGPLRPWLFALTRREAYRHAAPPTESAADGPLEELGLRAGWGSPDPEARVGRAEEAERLSWAIATLNPKDREVLVLREIEGLSGEETAAVLGLEVSSMKSRLHRARLELMARLREGSEAVIDHEREAGGLRCGEVLAQLSDHVDGTLDAPARARVEAHLRGCTVCERFGGRFARTVTALRTRLGERAPVDPAAFERVLAHWR